jgi:hypothetical protein
MSLLLRIQDRERAQLGAAIDTLLKVATTIPLTSGIVESAKGFQMAFDLSFQDAVVLVSVIEDLQTTKPAQCCFLSRDKGFANQSIRDMLNDFACGYCGNFDEALGDITKQIRER